MPPPVFSERPIVERIERTGHADVYRVTLREPHGEPKTALFTVRTDPVPHVAPDWDVFWGWPEDADSMRAIVRQIIDFHRFNLST